MNKSNSLRSPFNPSDLKETTIMLLAIDTGNTHTVIGVFEAEKLQHQWRVQTDRDKTADELASLFFDLFSLEKITFDDIQSVIIACVVPPILPAFISFCTKYIQSTPLMVNDAMNTGITILTDRPEEVGADRIVNAVAGFEQYKSPLIIVDFGTAITFDCVSAHGEYLGGAIAPGLAISLDALGLRTAKLPRVDISTPPDKPIGTNTVSAIKSGILYGYAGLVDGLVARLREEFKPTTPKVIATGGMAELIAPYAESIEYVNPMLTLEGLRLLYEKNK